MTPIDYEEMREAIAHPMERGSVPMFNELVAKPLYDRCLALEAERDALTATNNSLVDTVRELRVVIELNKVHEAIETPKLTLFSKLKAAQSHAATLAGCLEAVLGDYVVDTEDGTRDNDVVQSLYDQRREAVAALAAYNEATGEGVK